MLLSDGVVHLKELFSLRGDELAVDEVLIGPNVCERVSLESFQELHLLINIYNKRCF